MRLHILSDLHLELDPWSSPGTDVDVVVLAGDIGIGAEAVRWAKEQFPAQPVVQIAGNHEGYGLVWDEMIKACRDEASGSNVRFLENEAAEIAGVRFLGAVLWTDFELLGEPAAPKLMELAAGAIRDYEVIETAAGMPLTPEDTRRWHFASRAWLEAEFAKDWDGPTVVVTHFPVHGHCCHGDHLGSPLSAYFVSHLKDVIEAASPELWIHGHTHWNVDLNVGKTRIYSNQRGYYGNSENPSLPFDPGAVVEI